MQVDEFIAAEKPDVIIDAAAKVGGILANDSFPYDFLMDNMLIQNNLIRSANEHDAEVHFFGFELHLSETRSSATQRRLFAYGTFRANKRVVRNC